MELVPISGLDPEQADRFEEWAQVFIDASLADRGDHDERSADEPLAALAAQRREEGAPHTGTERALDLHTQATALEAIAAAFDTDPDRAALKAVQHWSLPEKLSDGSPDPDWVRLEALRVAERQITRFVDA